MQVTRYLRADGSVAIERLGMRWDLARDLFHLLLSMRWWQLVVTTLLLYLAVSLLFALLYLAGGGCIQGAQPGSLHDAFFFSVQTLATIGYGQLSPQGTYANVLVCLEAYCGLFSVALMTGLAFSKFSRPTGRVMFSQCLVVGPREGRPALTFRLANARASTLVEARCSVHLARNEVSQEGEMFRRLFPLELRTPLSPVFALTFTATHFLDGASPLAGWTAQALEEARAELIVTVVGLDDLLSQTVHARHVYCASDIRWGASFGPTFRTLPDGRSVVDLNHFDEVLPDHEGRDGKANEESGKHD